MARSEGLVALRGRESWSRLATLYNQLANSFLGQVPIATTRYWRKFVHAGQAGTSAERWLIEGAQLAAVQLGAFLAQQVDRFDTNLKVSRDRFLIKPVGLSGQFEFPVQRLVGHTQQSPVRHAEAIALGRYRSRFHVYADGA